MHNVFARLTVTFSCSPAALYVFVLAFCPFSLKPHPRLLLNLFMYVFVFVCVCVCLCVPFVYVQKGGIDGSLQKGNLEELQGQLCRCKKELQQAHDE